MGGFSCCSLHALMPTRFAGSNEFERRRPETWETGPRQRSRTSATALALAERGRENFHWLLGSELNLWNANIR